MYDDHLRLIGKRVLDFLLVLIELFLARCYGWGATSEYRLKIGDFAPTGPVDPKFQVEGGRPTNHSFSRKTRLNDLSSGIKIWTGHSFVLSQITRLTNRWTDRQTDGQTEFSSLDRVCIPCSAVKMKTADLITNNKDELLFYVMNDLLCFRCVIAHCS